MLRKVRDNGVEWLCLALMVVLACDLMLGVFSRYVLFRTFTWYDEIARACFVWVVFLGAAVGVKRGSHFGLHMLIDITNSGAVWANSGLDLTADVIKRFDAAKPAVKK